MSSTALAFGAMVALWFGRSVVRAYLGREGRIDRKLAARPRSLARGTSGDALRLVGRVRRRGGPLRAPISGRPCVAFQAFIDEYNGDVWITRVNARDAQSFVIVDESGEALVDTSGPFELTLVTDERGSTALLGAMGRVQLQAVRSYLNAGDLSSLRARKVRYREAILKDGQLVAVGGAGRQSISGEAPSSGPREPPTWLVLRGTADQPLLISNSVRALGGRWALPGRTQGRST